MNISLDFIPKTVVGSGMIQFALFLAILIWGPQYSVASSDRSVSVKNWEQVLDTVCAAMLSFNSPQALETAEKSLDRELFSRYPLFQGSRGKDLREEVLQFFWGEIERGRLPDFASQAAMHIVDRYYHPGIGPKTLNKAFVHAVRASTRLGHLNDGAELSPKALTIWPKWNFRPSIMSPKKAVLWKTLELFQERPLPIVAMGMQSLVRSQVKGFANLLGVMFPAVEQTNPQHLLVGSDCMTHAATRTYTLCFSYGEQGAILVPNYMTTPGLDDDVFQGIVNVVQDASWSLDLTWRLMWPFISELTPDGLKPQMAASLETHLKGAEFRFLSQTRYPAHRKTFWAEKDVSSASTFQKVLFLDLWFLACEYDARTQAGDLARNHWRWVPQFDRSNALDALLTQHALQGDLSVMVSALRDSGDANLSKWIDRVVSVLNEHRQLHTQK